VEYSKEPFFVIDTAYYVVPKTDLDLRWLYYAVKYHKLGEIDDGSPIPSTTRAAVYVKNFEVPLLPEQKAIASVLRALDDKIDLNRKTCKTLEAMAQALFKSWFVDFDPVRAKMEVSQPYGMDAATAALFPDNLVDSEVGLIPEGWAPCRIEKFIELAYGKALKAIDRIPGHVPVYGSGGITGYHDQFLVNGPSIIVGRKGTVGTLYWEDQNFFPIDTVFFVKASVPLSYCYYLLQTLGLKDMNTDAAVPGLNRSNVYRLIVPYANEYILKAFDQIVKPIRDQIFRNTQQIQTLENVRDYLLPKLISGEVRTNCRKYLCKTHKLVK
jgi:type I restriction enzyme S subunit